MRRGFLYIVAIMHWFSRKVLTWRLSNTESQPTMRSLKPITQLVPGSRSASINTFTRFVRAFLRNDLLEGSNLSVRYSELCGLSVLGATHGQLTAALTVIVGVKFAILQILAFYVNHNFVQNLAIDAEHLFTLCRAGSTCS
jgi:hypothetical protein